MLTISKLKRWSINYYIDTVEMSARATRDRARVGGGLGEYYSERDTRTPTWLLAGDVHTVARLVGLADRHRAGRVADAEVVARWLDDGIAPVGTPGRAFGARGVHGFDLTFCAPKSVSLMRALLTDDVVGKAITTAHTTALAEAMEYLAAHAGYTRVHNPRTGEKDLVNLPGLVAVAYQHETSRCGDPHLHTHVIVPNRQARADGQMVSIDGTSLYHEARAAGVIYQATLRRELNHSMGFEWAPVDPSTGMAELAGVDRDTITAWSQRSSQLREWAAHNLNVIHGPLSAAQLAAAQKATRPTKPEELAWATLVEQWRADERGLHLDRAAFHNARAARRAASHQPLDRARLADAAEKIEKAAFTRADLVEIIGAQLPIDTDQSPRQILESVVDDIGVRLTAPRAAHQREGHERYTLDVILDEERTVLDLVDARDDRALLWIKDEDTAGLSPDQKTAVENIGRSPWLVQPLSAPAGAGKTTSMRALRAAACRRHNGHVLVLAPTGNAADVAVREGAGDEGLTIAKAIHELGNGRLQLGPHTLVIIDEAAMVGTSDLRQILTATTAAGAKAVLVGDQHQLAPVKARGGMFAQLCTDLPWAQHLSEVWRMHDPEERAASVALRSGGPAPLRRAIKWYADHHRLHTGEPIAMAHDALVAYNADIAAGKDTLLIADTREMAAALNRRIHHDTIDSHAATVAAAHGDQIAVGDLIISTRNDATIPVMHAETDVAEINPVRNGNRWRVYAVDPQHHRVAARRLDDDARAVFSGNYLAHDVRHGYVITVHGAQGATADTTHAVLSDTTSRAMAYVAMTRGRESNTAYLYDRNTEAEESLTRTDGIGLLRRGTHRAAEKLIRMITGGRDDRSRTAHHIAADEDREQLPERARCLLIDRRCASLKRRRVAHQNWLARHADQVARMLLADKHFGHERNRERGLGL